MKKILTLFLLIASLFFSCNVSENKEKKVLTGIPLNIEEDISLSLSIIAEKIETIELEETEESMINPDRIQRILISDDNVILAEFRKVLIFNRNGKFVCSVGRRGQGPGEFNVGIFNIAIDEKNKYLFLNTTSKIICYDLTGKFLREIALNMIEDIIFINNELLVFSSNMEINDSNAFITRSIIYKLNNELQITDSITVQDTYFEQRPEEILVVSEFFIREDTLVSAFYANNYFEKGKPLLYDTLYSLKNNCLIPELKLDIKNNGIDSNGNLFIIISNIYRSSRYIFANYNDKTQKGMGYQGYHFCYDSKTEKGYNVKDGFTDDINKIDKPIKIRPFNHDTEMFYYLHTHIKPDDLEEPNPTLYIGKLKK